ncbi:MAG: long-chain fatty acid--CoA ligase [Sulfurimicrobium sp.]|nr:long-chain fatty acid--CoA ligase [Sulfurimicrobium sp.]
MHLDLISCDAAGTLPGLFEQRVQRTPEAPAYRQFDAASGAWRSLTWRETGARVERWRRALARENLAPGERVAILLHNSVEWVCFDQAALSLGLVVVPLYPSDSPDNIAYILADSGARLLLLGTQGRWETLATLCAGLDKVLCLRRPAAVTAGEIALECVEDWLARADQSAAISPHRADTHALATLVYTSGTSGQPKGVMLTHHNILWNAEAVLKAIPGYREDVYLSFLPLSHAFERTVGYYVPIMAGSCVAHARSLKELAEDLCVVRPSVLIAVPRIFEGVHAKVRQQLREKGPLARLLFGWTVAIGWRRFEAMQGRGRALSWWQRLAWPLLRRLVADRILARLGGRLRLAVSGGAPLYGEISRCFIGLGLPLVQGYGLSESSPVLAANRPEDNIPDSVGAALPGVEIRIGDDGELLARAPCVMRGYWSRPEATRAAIDPDGWLHTGDQARIAGGHVFICGRLKEILVTSSGEKVPPADLEMAIGQEPLFEQAMVVGEGRPHLAALLVLNRSEWEKLAASLGLKADQPGALAQPAAQAAVMRRIKAALRGFPRYARVRAVVLTLEPWSIENGLITPTLKLRRTQIEQRFHAEIEHLFASSLSV